jgi:hypothetical protein
VTDDPQETVAIDEIADPDPGIDVQGREIEGQGQEIEAGGIETGITTELSLGQLSEILEEVTDLDEIDHVTNREIKEIQEIDLNILKKELKRR